MTMLPFGDVAPIQRRAIAYVIDALIAAVIPVIGIIVVSVMFMSALGGSDPVAAMAGISAVAAIIGVLSLAWFIVYTVMQAGRGSIGMRAQKIRLANASDGAPLGFGRALLRNVIWGLAASIVVGYFTALFDGSGRFQGWHDKVAGSMMLDQRDPAPGSGPQFLDSTQPPLVPDHSRAAASSPSMPGFAAPASPSAPSAPQMSQTSMPGFAQTSGAFAPPQTSGAFAPPQTDDARPQTDVEAPSAAPVFAPAAAPGAASIASQSAVEDELVEQTVLSPRIRRDAPDYDLPEDPLISFVPGVTQEPPARPAEPMAAEPELAEPALAEPVAAPVTARVETPTEVPVPARPALMPEDDEVEDIESTRISVPGHRLVFTWDDGQRATVSGRTVFGRNPEEPGAVTNVAVRDETRSLSKTHFEAGANTSGGWVMDRQSTNGTMVVREGVRIACPPGQRVPVRLGDALEIGDRIVTIGGYV